jgi:hypothetical protein
MPNKDDLKDPRQIAESSRGLTQAIYEEQKRRASQSKVSGERSLAHQLQMQSRSMMQNRQQLSEQGFLAGRSIDQQAAGRGLGSSGLKNLSHIQSQMAQGGAVNQLEGQNQDFQRSIMDARRGINQDYTGNMAGADLSMREGMLQADREALASEEKKRDFLMQLYSIALEGGTAEDIQKILTISGYKDTDFSSEQLEGILGSVDENWLHGDEKYNRKGVWVQEQMGGLTEVLPKLFHMAGHALFKPNEPALRYDEAWGLSSAINKGGKNRYTISGQAMTLTTEEAVQKVQELYSGKKYVGKEIIIKADKGNNVAFYVGNKQFKTYNQAVAYMDKQRAGK